MRIAIVSTYPPRPCGIGTFSRDLRGALRQAGPEHEVDVVAIVRDDTVAEAPEVVQVVRQDVRGDYAAAARTLTVRGTDVVVIEHEYGIFGGEAGSHVLALVQELDLPLVVTLHTVLSEPSVPQAEVLRALCERASLVTVFTETARRMVVAARLVAPERVRVVPHGAPDVVLGVAARDSAREDDQTVLATFGLIAESKGIETAIRALPAVVARHPGVLYRVAGRTHPEVVAYQGESYRLSLERLVVDLGLEQHVQFFDRFFSDDELADLLSQVDLYLTPYRSREQIVSGALTFAVAAGLPVVSTPYFYAEDLLSSGAGRLVPFDDPGAMAKQINQLLDDPDALALARKESARVGSGLSWPSVGALMLGILLEAVALAQVDVHPSAVPQLAGPHLAGSADWYPAAPSPRVRTDHLLTLVDDVGIIQHADGVVPSLESGYCVDDVARLVIVALGLDRSRSDLAYARMLAQGLGFLRYAWAGGAPGMHNLMAYDRRWLDEPHLGDHLGRAAWALGEVVASHPPRAVRAPALHLLGELAPALAVTASPRGTAFMLVGLARPATAVLPAELQALLRAGADRLASLYDETSRAGWRWFEDVLAYDNARLPQALLAAGHRLGDQSLVERGLESLDWYAQQCALDEPVVRLVGNQLRRRGSAGPDLLDAEGDEQPLDATALVEACVEAYTVTRDRIHARRAVNAFGWFLGRNRLGVPVYDFATGGCHDGVGTETLNDNEGAESTLAFLQALLVIDQAGLQASLPRP